LRSVILRLLLLATFLILLAYGIIVKEPVEVLRNAKVICLSCLGL